MSLVEVSFHDTARAELKPGHNHAGTIHWTSLLIYNVAGKLVGEVVLFPANGLPLKVTEAAL